MLFCRYINICMCIFYIYNIYILHLYFNVVNLCIQSMYYMMCIMMSHRCLFGTSVAVFTKGLAWLASRKHEHLRPVGAPRIHQHNIYSED